MQILFEILMMMLLHRKYLTFTIINIILYNHSNSQRKEDNKSQNRPNLIIKVIKSQTYRVSKKEC